MSDLLSFENETFTNFAFYSGVVLGKTLLMGPITSMARMRNKAFCNPEDVARFAPGKTVNLNHPMVERIRRCHLNDLENVIPFTLVGLLYVSANPYPHRALSLFRLFAASRLLHTVCYLLPLPQPSRAICYGAGVMATCAMGFFVFMRLTCLK